MDEEKVDNIEEEEVKDSSPTKPSFKERIKKHKRVIVLLMILGILFIVVSYYILNASQVFNSTTALPTTAPRNIPTSIQNSPTPYPTYFEPEARALDDGETLYRKSSNGFSLILPEGFSAKPLPQRTRGIGYHEISNGNETYRLLDSLGGGPPYEPEPIGYEIYGGNVVRMDKGNFAGCSSDCYTIISEQRDAIFDPQDDNFNIKNLEFILMNYNDERTDSFFPSGGNKTLQNEIINDVKSNFPEYDTISFVSIVNSSFGLGAAGTNNEKGGVYFWFERNLEDNTWSAVWQGKEFPMCQERFNGDKYSCPWEKNNTDN